MSLGVCTVDNISRETLAALDALCYDVAKFCSHRLGLHGVRFVESLS